MPRPHPTSLMPVGTVIDYDGDTWKKTHDSRRESFPWTSETGGEYGDEWMAEMVARGAQVKEPDRG